MLAKATALAMIGSAAAFQAPMMALTGDRRAAIQTAAAGAVVIGASQKANAMAFDNLAPYVEIFDNVGCDKQFAVGYSGPASGDNDDERCVKVSMERVKVSQAYASKQIQQFSGFKQSGIDVPQISNVKKPY